jgi:hypothetical protein
MVNGIRWRSVLVYYYVRYSLNLPVIKVSSAPSTIPLMVDRVLDMVELAPLLDTYCSGCVTL